MQYPTLIHERVDLARKSLNPTVICRMPSGWAVLGDSQFFPGYCLLLSDPVVPSLNEMDRPHRIAFLNDMATIGDSLLKCTGAYRVNYEILGNQDAALHAHIFPRYLTEPADRIKGPVWHYSREVRASVKIDFIKDKSLMEALRGVIGEALEKGKEA